jgi:hypothetical protein
MVVNRVERTSLGQALAEWARHECTGGGRWVEQLAAAGRPIGHKFALENLLLARAGLIAPLLLAEPIETWRVDLAPADVPTLHTLEHSLEAHSLAMVVAANPDGDHVRGLVSGGEIGGAILATSRVGDDRVFFIDGLHRVWAWSELVRQGRGGSIRVSLVVTERMSWWAEQAEHIRRLG